MILFSLFQLLSSIKLKSNLPSFLDKPKYPNSNQSFWHRDLSPQKSKWDGSGFNVSKHPFKLGPHEHIQHKKGSPSIFYLGKRPKLVALPMPTHPIRLGLFGTQKMIFKSIFWIKDIDLSTRHFTLARYEGALRKVLSRTRDRLQKSRGLAKWLKVWQNWSKLLVGIFSSKTKSRILTSLTLFTGFLRTLSQKITIYLAGLSFVAEERTATLSSLFVCAICLYFVFDFRRLFLAHIAGLRTRGRRPQLFYSEECPDRGTHWWLALRKSPPQWMMMMIITRPFA